MGHIRAKSPLTISRRTKKFKEDADEFMRMVKKGFKLDENELNLFLRTGEDLMQDYNMTQPDKQSRGLLSFIMMVVEVSKFHLAYLSMKDYEKKYMGTFQSLASEYKTASSTSSSSPAGPEKSGMDEEEKLQVIQAQQQSASPSP